MRLKSIRAIEPKPSRCIEVDSKDKLFAVGGASGSSVLSHNSVVQRNIILGCILRPDRWRFLGIDLKKVELSAFRAYENVVLGIGTTLEDALLILRFGQETMMKRYAELEQLGFNNFLDLPDSGPALLIMVDEAGELLSPSGVKALAADTPIPTIDGLKPLEEVQIGDTLFDNFSKPTKVLEKYEPPAQDAYSLTISRDSDSAKEAVVAGSEHYWVVYIESHDGSISEEQLMTTEELFTLKQEQNRLPTEDRAQIKFKKSL